MTLTQRIFQEAKNKNNPLTSAGLIMFSLETEIPNKYDSKKAYKYKQPNFTEIKLLTLEQLEKINEIINPIETKKEISIMDFTKINQFEKPKNIEKTLEFSEETEEEKPKKEIKKMTKYDKLTKHKQNH